MARIPRRQARLRGSGPAAHGPRASFHASVQPGLRCPDAQGKRHAVGARRERGPLARIPRRQARLRGSGPAAHGPRASFHASVQPGLRCPDAQGKRHAVGARRERGPLARIPRRQARLRGSGPAARGPRASFHASVQPGLRCPDAQGKRHGVGARWERGPLARIRAAKARLPGEAGQRPAVPGLVP